MLDIADDQDSAPAANGNMLFIKPSANRAVLQMLGVNDIWIAGRPSPERLDVGGVAGRLVSPHGDASFLEDQPSSKVVSATGPGDLWLRDSRQDGWTAILDGKTTESGEGTVFHLVLTQGRHVVRFTYEPPGLRLGCWLLLVGALGLAIMLVPALSLRPKKSNRN